LASSSSIHCEAGLWNSPAGDLRAGHCLIMTRVCCLTPLQVTPAPAARFLAASQTLLPERVCCCHAAHRVLGTAPFLEAPAIQISALACSMSACRLVLLPAAPPAGVAKQLLLCCGCGTVVCVSAGAPPRETGLTHYKAPLPGHSCSTAADVCKPGRRLPKQRALLLTQQLWGSQLACGHVHSLLCCCLPCLLPHRSCWCLNAAEPPITPKDLLRSPR
jgi:hypothetical protein